MPAIGKVSQASKVEAPIAIPCFNLYGAPGALNGLWNREECYEEVQVCLGRTGTAGHCHSQ